MSAKYQISAVYPHVPINKQGPIAGITLHTLHADEYHVLSAQLAVLVSQRTGHAVDLAHVLLMLGQFLMKALSLQLTLSAHLLLEGGYTPCMLLQGGLILGAGGVRTVGGQGCACKHERVLGTACRVKIEDMLRRTEVSRNPNESKHSVTYAHCRWQAGHPARA